MPGRIADREWSSLESPRSLLTNMTLRVSEMSVFAPISSCSSTRGRRRDGGDPLLKVRL